MTSASARRIRLALIAIAAMVSGASIAAAEPGLRPEPAAMCWSPEALASRADAKVIRKGTAKAIVTPPRDALAPYAPAKRGAIRRVELPPGVKKIALTFDNCEQPYEVAGYDAEIVNVLRAANARATFFAGGKWMMTHPQETQQLLSDRLFEVANHSWEHRNLRLLEGQRLVDEIRWAQAAYERQVDALAARQCLARDGNPFIKTGANARMGLFRFPFGACNPVALDRVAEAGLLPIQWDISSGDPTKTLTGAAMAAAVVRQVRPGSIVLFHANGRGWNTAAALRIIIPKLRAMGYEFATVGDLLSTEGATWKSEPICYDSRPGDVDRHDDLARRLDAAYERFTAKFAPKAGKAVEPNVAPAKPPAPNQSSIPRLQPPAPLPRSNDPPPPPF